MLEPSFFAMSTFRTCSSFLFRFLSGFRRSSRRRNNLNLIDDKENKSSDEPRENNEHEDLSNAFIPWCSGISTRAFSIFDRMAIDFSFQSLGQCRRSTNQSERENNRTACFTRNYCHRATARRSNNEPTSFDR